MAPWQLGEVEITVGIFGFGGLLRPKKLGIRLNGGLHAKVGYDTCRFSKAMHLFCSGGEPINAVV